VFRRIDDFIAVWDYESDATLRVLSALTDASLARRFHPDVRTLGRLAWHITQSIPEMGARTGLALEGPGEDDPVPTAVEELVARYQQAAKSLAAEVAAKWTDLDLEIEDDMYGERWPRGRTLFVISAHQAHHRAQLMVLMRLADLTVPGVYGPAKEDWAQFGMAPPE
jgi:uncharacterized damage-inducible protein DinB